MNKLNTLSRVGLFGFLGHIVALLFFAVIKDEFFHPEGVFWEFQALLGAFWLVCLIGGIFKMIKT